MMHRRGFAASGAAALGASLAPQAFGQEAWPRRPVTIVVPVDAGGSVDRLARGFAQYMPKHLGQPMVVVDRAGASGMIGTNWLLSQPADGYTVMLTPATPFIPINILVTGARYKLEDFTFVNAQWTDYTALVVQKDRPWKTAGELIDAIKANPGKITTGVDFGSVGHISTLALLKALGLPPTAVRFVTFDGSGAMHTALAGGQIDFYISQAQAAEVIRDFVRVLAVFTEHRMPEYDAPPINEVLKPYHAQVVLLDGSVRTFVFPAAFKARRPADYAKFVEAYRATLQSPDFRKWLADNKMAGDWVGEARTTEIIRADFEQLKLYRDLLKKT
jgi:tripartite-type tricarboxylate transporter receptor subunit TctC